MERNGVTRLMLAILIAATIALISAALSGCVPSDSSSDCAVNASKSGSGGICHYPVVL